MAQPETKSVNVSTNTARSVAFQGFKDGFICGNDSAVPSGLVRLLADPALKRWAIVARLFGTMCSGVASELPKAAGANRVAGVELFFISHLISWSWQLWNLNLR